MDYNKQILELKIKKSIWQIVKKETYNYSTEETSSVNINDNIMKNPKLTANFLNAS